MKNLGLAAVFSVLVLGSAHLAAAEVWTILAHPSLVNLDPGADRLWNTADDSAGGPGIPLGGGPGANPNGANAVWDSFGTPNYLSGTWEVDGIGIGTFMYTANSPVLETLGVGPAFAAPLDTSAANVVTNNPDQTVTSQRFWDLDGLPGSDFQSQSSGWWLEPGDDPLIVTGDADVAANINFLMPLVPGDADLIVFFDGSFLDLSGAPLFGDFTGLAYHTPIPIPPLAPLAALLGGVLLRRRRTAIAGR